MPRCSQLARHRRSTNARGILWSFLLLLVAVAMGCSSDNGGGGSTGPKTPTDVSGTWTYLESMSNGRGISCSDTGTLAITQSGVDFSAVEVQTGYCDSLGTNSGTQNISGGTAGDNTITFPAGVCSYQGALLDAPVDSMNGSVTCSVSSGNRRITLTGQWFAVKGVDLAPPTIAATLSFPVGDYLYVPTDTFTIALTASDDRRVLWAGYRLGPPANHQDSVRVVQKDFAGQLRFPIPAGWVGYSSLTVFARDALGRLTDSAAGTVQTFDAIRRPTHTVDLGANARYFAFDPKRNALYVEEAERAQIARVDVSTAALGTPIDLPMTPMNGAIGLDLTPGGDSIVAALPGTANLAFASLVSGTVTTVAITPDAGATLTGVIDVRSTSDGKVWVYGMQSKSGYYFFNLWEYDVAGGTQQRRTDMGDNGAFLASPPFGVSPDRSKMILLEKGTSCAQIYDALTSTVSACKTRNFYDPSTPASTTTGDKWLLHNLLYDGNLTLLSTVVPVDPGAAGMTIDGSAAFFTTPYGYEKLGLPGGALLEKVRFPFVGSARVSALADGTHLVAIVDLWNAAAGRSTTRVLVVDLR